MKRVLIALSLSILPATLGFSQNCGLISDEAGKITNSSAIRNGASSLGGADVHVVTVPSVAKYGGSLDDRQPNIRNGRGKMKITLTIEAPRARYGEDKYTALICEGNTEINRVYGKTLKVLMSKVSESVQLHIGKIQ